MCNADWWLRVPEHEGRLGGSSSQDRCLIFRPRRQAGKRDVKTLALGLKSRYRNDRHAVQDVMFRALGRCMADIEPINLLEADERVIRSSGRSLASRRSSS